MLDFCLSGAELCKLFGDFHHLIRVLHEQYCKYLEYEGIVMRLSFRYLATQVITILEVSKKCNSSITTSLRALLFIFHGIPFMCTAGMNVMQHF